MERELLHINQIKQQGLLPLFYHENPSVCLAVTNSLYAAGVKIIEFTNRGTKALENFKKLIKERDNHMPDLLLGIGTIKTAEHASHFLAAGADILISPVFDNAVCDIAYMNKILWIPGCMTPTEIHVADSAGCRMIKLFPGNVLTFSFVEAINPLFPNLDFVVTGGVEINLENIKAWFGAGVSAVGMGSKLITKKILDEKNYSQLTENTEEVLSLIRQFKKK